VNGKYAYRQIIITAQRHGGGVHDREFFLQHFVVADNVVTLRGNVESTYARSEAERIAKETDGVKKVTNQLKVAPPPKPTPAKPATKKPEVRKTEP